MAMLQAVHLAANNAPCCGVPEGRCLQWLGVSGRKAIVSACSYHGYHRVHSHANLRGLRCAFVCEARRNPEFSRQNKHGFSRSKNRKNETRGNFENLEEDMLSSNSKNGPLISLSSIPKSQATAAPGPREKEIVELFRKVQSRLRERAAMKEEKKVETSKGQGKENGTVDSLLRLLRKHSGEQVKGGNGGGGGKDFSLDQLQDNDQSNGGRSTWLSDSDSAHESQEASISTVARPPSKFQRRSPISRSKCQPVSYNEDEIPHSSGNNQDQTSLELDAEPELDAKDEFFFPDEGIADLLEGDSHDTEQTYNDERGKEQQVVEHEDLSSLKLPELRALAKSRGVKGFSKMKKGELMELLSGS